jgi:hypothetical protein
MKNNDDKWELIILSGLILLSVMVVSYRTGVMLL